MHFYLLSMKSASNYSQILTLYNIFTSPINIQDTSNIYPTDSFTQQSIPTFQKILRKRSNSQVMFFNSKAIQKIALEQLKQQRQAK